VQGVFYGNVGLSVTGNPRQQGIAREFGQRAIDILRFYTSIIDDFPYQSITLAVVENQLPGGHSPAYFAMLNQPLPTSPLVWRNDPVNFDSFPDFFLAHELAHQWWGQAVGWNNYHEQWLSEGLAQYFAALYAERSRGSEVFEDLLRQMRRTAMSNSNQGPVYLGYRLGHIRGQSRVFRALVYNKGGAVLHMLRRLIGDEAFFRGLRRFYFGARFSKAGSEDLRRAFEIEAGRSLERFFERWIHGSTLPRIRFTYRTETANATASPGGEEASTSGERAGSELVLRFDQSADVFDVPVTVTLNYASGRSAQVIVRLHDRITETRIPLAGPLRGVEINRDHGALADIRRH
jgi:aminopeptidase N